MSDYDDYHVYVKTDHSHEITKFFDVLKEMLNDVNLEFIRCPDQEQKILNKSILKKKQEDSDEEKKSDDESSDDSSSEEDKKSKKKVVAKSPEKKTKSSGGMRIVAMDNQKTILIYARLFADEFTDFYVKSEKYNIQLNLIEFSNFLKTVDRESIMTMYVDKYDENILKFEMDNEEKHYNDVFSQKIMDSKIEENKIPQDSNFDIVVIMSSVDFRNLCSKLITFSQKVEITCTLKSITFSAITDEPNPKTIFSRTYKNHTANVRIASGDKDNKKKINMVQAVYQLKHLTTFGKCVNLCSEMQLFLKNDYPLFVQYTIGNLGKLLVGLIPVNLKTIKKSSNYDDANDEYYDHTNPIIKNT